MSPRRGSPEQRWLLPSGVEEVLAPEAYRLERMRRELVDLFETWGYDLVMPPVIEYLESLLTGPGADLELQIFKVTDQETGRLMGLRADMTPQVARMDARYMTSEVGPVRLCYIGTVLHARPNPFFGSRSPLQVGAELYGHRGVASDVEVIALMLAMLARVGLDEVHLDLGHFGVYRALVGGLGLSTAEENELFDALQRKSPDDIEQTLLAAAASVPPAIIEQIIALNDLNGGREVLGRAREVIGAGSPASAGAIDELERLADACEARVPAVPLHFDLAELRGYRYHGGVIFSAFVPDFGQEVARGGRYDQSREVFGRARPATGFSADLKLLMSLTTHDGGREARAGVLAPAGSEPELLACIEQLRADGERVLALLPGQEGGASELNCDRMIERREGQWHVVPVR